jgi:hypothetical protein
MDEKNICDTGHEMKLAKMKWNQYLNFVKILDFEISFLKKCKTNEPVPQIKSVKSFIRFVQDP